MLSVVFLASVLQGEPAKIDRSGEPELRASLAAVAKLENTTVTVVGGSRQRDVDAYEMDETLQINFGKGGQFRASATGGMDSGMLTILSDGKTVIVDPLGESRLVTVRDASPDISDAAPQFGRHAAYGGMFLMMRSGAAAFDKLAAADVPITLKDLGVQEEIVWKSKEYTNVRLVIDKKTKLPLEIVYDDLDYRRNQQGGGGGFRQRTLEQPSTRQVLFYDPLPKGTSFVVVLPKEKFTDLRKKPDSAVGTIKP